MIGKSQAFYHLLVLSVIIVAGIYLRASHMYFGLPEERYHPDEHRAAKTVRDCLEGEYRTRYYHHPPLIKNCAFVWTKFLEVFTPLDSHRYYLQAIKSLRQISFACGVAAIWCVYLLGCHFLPAWYAIGAAAAYAVFPVTVFSSKYGLPDMLLSLLILIALIYQMKLYDAPSKKRYFINGLLLALACSAKYNAVFLIVSFCAAQIMIMKKAGLPLKKAMQLNAVMPFIIGGIVGASVGFPIFQIESKSDCIKSFFYEFQHLFIRGHGSVKISGGDYYYVFHWIRSIFPAAGVFLVSAMILGIILMFFKPTQKQKILLSFVVPYYVVMEYVYKVAVHYERYVLPLVGVYVIAALFACKAVRGWLGTYMRISSTALYPILITGLLFFPAYRTIRLLISLEPDTRTQAKQWIKSAVPAGSRFLLQWPLSGYYPDLEKMGHKIVEIKSSAKDFSSKIMSADYIIISSLCYARYFNESEQNSPIALFYETVLETLEPVYEAYPSYMTYMVHNPVIKIYKVMMEKEQP
ncbi:glycosyltransferase family 39 protein [bacterium]|nr:glycosyltransferase family 39 protein [bacterium]